MERADIVQARAEWRRVQDETPCGHLVFLDESGAKTNRTRLYGRAPALKEGDVVVMDNLRAHKSSAAQQAIEEHGARVLFLPAYSPDLNPIEKMWSKVKQLLRGLKAWNDDELFTAIGQALDKVTASDAKGWFASCGYSNFQS